MSTLGGVHSEGGESPAEDPREGSAGAQGVLPLVAQGELPLAIPSATVATSAATSAIFRPDDPAAFMRGAPQLSELGKRIELLRISRGISKQALARSSGTSRQQLWRVMTGKSELTGALCQRLASVLDVDSRSLSSAALGLPAPHGQLHDGDESGVRAQVAFADYVADPRAVAATMRTLPSGEGGIPLKRVLLDAIEDQTRRAGIRVPEWLLGLRGDVLNGDL